MPFPSSPTVGQTYTTPSGVTFEWQASGYWKAIGGGGSATPAPSGVSFPTWTTATRPASPSAGDSGWNTDTSTVEIWNGSSWGAVGGASGNVEFPTWTTATRPASPSAGVSGWNTDTGSIEVWNGSAWSDVGGGAGVEFPTWTTATRPASPSAGVSGWNTDTGSIEVWNGSVWDAVGVASGNVEFPTWTTATRPASPSAGVSGWNTDTSTVEIWNGSSWGAVGGASGNVEFPTWTTATRPASPSAGVSGWNTDTGNIEVWNGSAWSDVGGGAGVEFPTWTTATRPSSPSAGDSGLNTDTGNIEVWNGSAWSDVGGSAFFSGATQPTGMSEGDEWLDTSTTPAVLKKYVNDLGVGPNWKDVDQIGIVPTFTGTATPSGGDLGLLSGSATNITLSTTGGTGPYTYSLVSGSLPDGVTLSGSTISGTPSTTGPYSFVIRATDSTGAIFETTYSGTISISWSSMTNEYVRLQASDAAAGDKFGEAVFLSADGNTLVVGANNDANSGGFSAGSVYVFTRSGSTWTEQTRLQASDAAEYDTFGTSVSLSSDGNTLAVGARDDDNSGGSNAGSVYVFTFDGTTWTEQTHLQAADAAAGDQLGGSVSLSSDGNTLAVGARSDDNSGGTTAGSVYIFTRSGSTWTEQMRLQASNAAAADQFGTSVSLSSDGNTLAVGASDDDNSGGNSAGSAYVFTRSGSTWTEQTRLQASDAAAGDQFGWSVSLSSDGNTLAVGSWRDTNSGGTTAGSVYVFTRSGSTWTEQTRLQASDSAGADFFGFAVSVSSDGNMLAVGAYHDDNSGGTDAGSVYVFTRSGSTWTEQTRLQSSDAAASDRFGRSVSLSSDGNTLAVGASSDDNSGGADAGSVYMFGA